MLHDVIHHTKYHARDNILQSNILQASQTSLIDLFGLAAREQRSRTCKRLQELVDIWENENFLPAEHLNRLRQVISDPSANHSGRSSNREDIKEEAVREPPYLMPATHGDPSLPFHELPAANLMPHIIPKKSLAMRPDLIRPIQFATGPADESLINAVKDFLEDVSNIDDPLRLLDDVNLTPSLDELGQITYRNDAGDVVGDTYYGWSRTFCENMKSRHRGMPKGDDSRPSTSGSSGTRGRSSSPTKRRRDSSSDSDRSRGRYSVQRFSPMPAFQRERTPAFNTQPPGPDHTGVFPPQNPGLPPAFNPHMQPLPPPPLPIGPNGLPVPPPRPPNWIGPWPPRPPPPPVDSRQYLERHYEGRPARRS
jgi:hypothetical protein